MQGDTLSAGMASASSEENHFLRRLQTHAFPVPAGVGHLSLRKTSIAEQEYEREIESKEIERVVGLDFAMDGLREGIRLLATA